ncbi:hypothetical protein FJZ22_00535 [Candidatus Pacearchaeota archaeon]|nr:hypothetical protein [Candidatus Pacearchaeota archaeon]
MLRGFEFSFSWLFSLLVGALILILAIYGVQTLVGQERTISDSQTAQQLSGLLSPLQTSVETSLRPQPIIFPQPTEITLGCARGASTVQTRALATIGRNNAPGYAQETSGVAVFGNTTLIGTKVHSLIVPFVFPYKISDLVIIWTTPLCLVQAPETVLQTFGSDNASVYSVRTSVACRKGSRVICFDETRGCDVTVDQYLKRVTSEGKSLYYEGALLYGALVTPSALYECQVRSLLHRGVELTSLYAEKSALLSARGEGCSTAVGALTASYGALLRATNSSKQLAGLAEQAEALADEEQASICSLWRNT